LFEREKDFIKFIYLSKKVGVKFVKLLTVRAMAAATYVQGCGRACGWLAACGGIQPFQLLLTLATGAALLQALVVFELRVFSHFTQSGNDGEDILGC
jgi:hypothetical protein